LNAVHGDGGEHLKDTASAAPHVALSPQATTTTTTTTTTTSCYCCCCCGAGQFLTKNSLAFSQVL
jgi:hypothetical protein